MRSTRRHRETSFIPILFFKETTSKLHVRTGAEGYIPKTDAWCDHAFTHQLSVGACLAHITSTKVLPPPPPEDDPASHSLQVPHISEKSLRRSGAIDPLVFENKEIG